MRVLAAVLSRVITDHVIPVMILGNTLFIKLSGSIINPPGADVKRRLAILEAGTFQGHTYGLHIGAGLSFIGDGFFPFGTHASVIFGVTVGGGAPQPVVAHRAPQISAST